MDIIEIATRASRISKKTNKAQAFKYILRISETASEDLSEELAHLYRFFMPTKPKKAKTGVDWVNKSVAIKDLRSYMNQAYSDGVNLVGTNGHRLHVLYNTDLKAGFYDLAGSPIKIGVNFVDYKAIYPSGERELVQLDKLDVIPIPNSMACPFAYKITPSLGINKQYLDAALSLSDDYAIYFYPDKNKVTVEHEQGLAIIMCLRM